MAMVGTARLANRIKHPGTSRAPVTPTSFEEEKRFMVLVWVYSLLFPSSSTEGSKFCDFIMIISGFAKGTRLTRSVRPRLQLPRIQLTSRSLFLLLALLHWLRQPAVTS